MIGSLFTLDWKKPRSRWQVVARVAPHATSPAPPALKRLSTPAPDHLKSTRRRKHTHLNQETLINTCKIENIRQVTLRSKMALWTPYADVVLDLSKPAEETKLPPFDAQDVYHFGYNYVPSQLSPLSGASVCSYRPPTPTRISTLSPPMSPASSGKRSHSMMEDTLSDDPDFQAFERDALRAMAEKNGGTLLGNNPRMRRAVRCTNDGNDDSYRRQRERNNFAAKQSRDRRKLREIHLALKVSYLQKEVAGLKAVLASRVCVRCHQSCRC